MDKYGTGGQATRSMAHVHGMLDTKSYKHTHSHIMKYLLLINGNSGYANAPECYVIRTLSVLLTLALCDDGW